MPRTAAAGGVPAVQSEQAGPPWGALAVLLFGQGMAALDTSIVNVAGPSIRASLRTSAPALQLAISVYLLVYAALLISGSRLGRDHGPARVFKAGLAVFTAASFGCGAAPSAGWLVAARAVQGTGAALMVPQVLTFIGGRFDGPGRARAVGLYSFVLGAGVAVGQVLGGVLVTADLAGLGWRAVFLVNVPAGVVLGLLARRRLAADGPVDRARFDLPGLAFLLPGVLGVLVALSFGPQERWPVWTVGCLVAGGALLVGFAVAEVRSEAGGGSPLVPPSLLRARGVGGGLAVVFVVFAGYGGLLFTVAAYLQAGLGYSPLRSGLAFAFYAVGFGAVNMLWARLPAGWHRWVPVAGLVVLAASDLALGLAVGRPAWGAGQDLLLLTAGAGHGAGFGPTVAQVVRRAGPERAAAASGVVTTTTQLSIAVGVAALGSVYLAAGTGPGWALRRVCEWLAASAAVGLVLAVRGAGPDPA